ncbi:MAG TPA: hypothetical protein VM118_13950, partial [Acidobacteriota bacterium]|nr:hypothetical protein [Acidobacteriota bacterium]
MRKTTCVAVLLFGLIGVPASLQAQNDTVKYIPRYYDPAIEEMEDIADSLKEIEDSITSAIRDRQEEQEEREKENKKELRFDLSGIVAPDSPGVFRAAFHFPPVAQYRTGTCWSFGATSFLESEAARLTGREIKLSEMHTVYYEYVEKARRFIRERGDRWAGQGSEANAVVRMMRMYGAVPYEVYSGLIDGQERHDHSAMSDAVSDYLEYVKEQDDWNEEEAIAHVRVILDRYLGRPPTSFEFEGRTVTPQQFVTEVLGLNLDDYVSLISTSSLPFHTQGPFEVPDNWWHDSSYYNLPLDEWYGALYGAIRQGYTMVLAGDVSEPGWNGYEDICVVPDFDIPQEYINQHSREFRFYNHVTTDDHGIHAVGRTAIDGREWLLIKDSGRSARWGRFAG